MEQPVLEPNVSAEAKVLLCWNFRAPINALCHCITQIDLVLNATSLPFLKLRII